MALTQEQKMQLLATLSHARHSSNAYVETIGNSALVAYLQVQDTLQTIRSRPDTLTAIDVLMPFMLALTLDNFGGALIRGVSRQVLKRVTRSRIFSAQFVSRLPGVKLKSTTQLYSGVQVRHDFSKTVHAIEAHRLEQAWISKTEEGVGMVWSKLGSGELKKVLNGKYISRTRSPPGRSRTVSLVDSALRYATQQKMITNTIFDEVESRILIEENDDPSFYQELEKDIHLHFTPILVAGREASLNDIGDVYTRYFEHLVWALLFFGGSLSTERGPEHTGSRVRVKFLNDPEKDHALTHYLLPRFARGKRFYSETSSKDFDHFSETTHLIVGFRAAVRAMNRHQRDFGPAQVGFGS